MSEHTTNAQFSIELTPVEAILEHTGRMDFTKSWTGSMAGVSHGVMLSGGDPRSGSAGYVAMEVFTGSVDGRTGGFAVQQFGIMNGGAVELRYEIAPGSGTGELTGMTGSIKLDVVDGVHEVTLSYSI